MAQPPKDIQAKLRQMADEERVRKQLKAQYEAEMAQRYTRDVVPFTQWMSQRKPEGMAGGGPLDSLPGIISEAKKNPDYQRIEQYLKTRDAIPSIKLGSLPRVGDNGIFTAMNLPIGSGNIQISKDVPALDYKREIGPSVLTHEMAHAADRQMKQQFKEQRVKGNKFTEAYEKMVGPGGINRTDLFRRLNPDWAEATRTYRSTPEEVAGHGVGAFAGPNIQDSAPRHVDASAAQDFQVLLDLAQRNANNGPTGWEKIPAFFSSLLPYADGGDVKQPNLDTMKLALTRNNLGMHSPLEKAAMSVPRTKGTAQEFMTEVSKQPGFKKEEVEDRGIPMPEGKLTREQFVSHLKAHPHKKILVDVRHSDDDDTHHEEYTLPGGENYREVLLKLPEWAGGPRTMYKEAQLRREENPLFREMLQREIDELKASKAKHGEVYPGNQYHFGGEPGILASLRLKDRVGPNGEKILHVEEIQSDWHQEGRKKGYKGSPSQEAIKAGMDQARAMGYSDEQIQEMAPEEVAGFTAKGSSSVPNAPHKKSWHELALKHALTEATKGGYHGIAITPGEQQADRYDLSKHIDQITSYRLPDGSIKLSMVSKGNHEPVVNIDNAEKLEDAVGKDLAEKILNDKNDVNTWQGLDLKVGGKGMKGFYDKILVDALNKLGKKHGAQVGSINVVTKPSKIEKAGMSYYQTAQEEKPVHYFPITDSLRKQIKSEGLPQYKTGGQFRK